MRHAMAGLCIALLGVACNRKDNAGVTPTASQSAAVSATGAPPSPVMSAMNTAAPTTPPATAASAEIPSQEVEEQHATEEISKQNYKSKIEEIEKELNSLD